MKKEDKPSALLSVMAYGTELVQIYLNKRVSRSAAALSYFLTLSLFPALLCLYYAVGSIFPNMDITDLQQLEVFMPVETVNTIADYLSYISQHNETTMLIVGLVAAVTTAAATFRSLHNTMGDLQGGTRYRGFVSFFGSFVVSIIFMVALYLSVVVIAIGNNAIAAFFALLGFDTDSPVLSMLRFPLLLLMFIIILYAIYRYTAPKEIKGTFFPGAALAGIAVVLASMLFSYFIDLSVKYSLVYGAMASIIIYMFWMYVISTVLIMGNAFNVVIRDHKAYNESLSPEKCIAHSHKKHKGK